MGKSTAGWTGKLCRGEQGDETCLDKTSQMFQKRLNGDAEAERWRA